MFDSKDTVLVSAKPEPAVSAPGIGMLFSVPPKRMPPSVVAIRRLLENLSAIVTDSQLCDDIGSLVRVFDELYFLPSDWKDRAVGAVQETHIRFTRPDLEAELTSLDRFTMWLRDSFDGVERKSLLTFHGLTERQDDLLEKAWSLIQTVYEEVNATEQP